jgi:glucose/mannose transport system substrate-binding protein
MSSGEGWEMTHVFEDLLASSLGAEKYNGLWTGQTSWTDPGVTTALENLKRVVSYANQDHAALSWPAAARLAIDGQAACHNMGDWQIGEWTANGKVPGDDYLFGVTPGTSGIYVALSDMFALPQGAPNPENARAFLTTAASKEAEEAFNPQKGSVCARTDCDTSTFNAYLQAATSNWASDAIVPSMMHGAAAEDAWVKDISGIITLFVTSGDVATTQAALQQACVDNGVCS